MDLQRRFISYLLKFSKYQTQKQLVQQENMNLLSCLWPVIHNKQNLDFKVFFRVSVTFLVNLPYFISVIFVSLNCHLDIHCSV